MIKVEMFDIVSFKNEVNNIATKLHTLVEIKEYPEYGFAQVAYVTDKFGGTYAIIHVDLHTGEMVLDFGSEDAIKIKNMDILEAVVGIRMEDMLNSRDLSLIADLINSEY